MRFAVEAVRWLSSWRGALQNCMCRIEMLSEILGKRLLTPSYSLWLVAVIPTKECKGYVTCVRINLPIIIISAQSY